MLIAKLLVVGTSKMYTSLPPSAGRVRSCNLKKQAATRMILLLYLIIQFVAVSAQQGMAAANSLFHNAPALLSFYVLFLILISLIIPMFFKVIKLT